MRIIDAEELKRSIAVSALIDDQKTLEQIIDDLPTIEERKKGKWLRYGEDGNPNEDDTVFWQCDKCLETYTGRTTRIPKYCPNCGARMER